METGPWQASLLDTGAVATASEDAGADGAGAEGAGAEGAGTAWPPDPARVTRHELGRGAWVDHAEHWLPGADAWFARVVGALDWDQRTERIRGAEIPQPRLTAHLAVADLDGDLAPLRAVAAALSEHYGVGFERLGANLYRDGRDSVAWHGDRIARDRPQAVIAIVSLGESRRFRLRPREGGTGPAFDLGHGDLLVMGGTCQRTFRHAVPKVARAGPRVSLTFRHAYPPASPRPHASG